MLIRIIDPIFIALFQVMIDTIQSYNFLIDTPIPLKNQNLQINQILEEIRFNNLDFIFEEVDELQFQIRLENIFS